MFKFIPVTTFWAPVKIVLPGGEEQEFEGEFVYIDDAAWVAAQKMTNGDFLRAHWTGWRGIVDEDDKALPFSEAQRELLLGHSYIAAGVLAGYATARQGLRAKN